jgi:serine/threonine protein kinase
MAPEQTWSEDYTFPVDVWAFGCTLVRLFTLKDPYDTEYNVRTIIMSVAHGDLRPVEVQIEDVPHPDVRNVINECLQFQGNKRLTFNAIEHRLKIALDECKKKERRRIKDVKKERRIKRREDEARKKAKNANDAKEQRVAEEKNVTAIDVKPIESGGQEMDSTSQQDTELRLLLNKNNIGRFYDKLVAEGIRSKEDLVHLTLEDLTEWGMGRFEARKAVAAVRQLVDTGVIEGQ